MPRHRVLIAEDDGEHARALAAALVPCGCACEIVRTGAAALSAVLRAACDVVICDVRLGTSTDLELLVRLRTADPTLPVIIVTAHGSIRGAMEAVKHGAFEYLERPCQGDELFRHVCAARDGVRHPLQAFAMPALSGELAQESAAMRDLLAMVDLIARSSAPVLIFGESGSGKERVARLIHERGPRAARPFVAINAAAIPEHLLESELFGHTRGAYTGATHVRTGLFAEADGGTILLDEIGDMPSSLQPKLLRVLQSGEVRAVGSDHTRHVDVRILAATHRDLARLVAAGQFRDDLRYRLNTLTLRVPPLRERRADIPFLAREELSAARARNPDSPVRSLSDEAIADLQARAWLGNVRELESAMERLVVLGLKPSITVTDLSRLLAEPTERLPEAWQQDDGAPTMREMSRRYLDWTLKQTHGDKALAAARLGIDVSTLYRRQRAKN
jgi:two-component system response regulator HydG